MKTALITGATKGIGAATRDRLLENGYKVVFTSRAKSGPSSLKNAEHVSLDICSIDSVNEFVRTVRSKSLKIDLLVLNAGFTHFVDSSSTFEDLTPELFSKTVEANLINNYRILFELKEALTNDSHVIFISSVAAYTGVGSNLAYSISKGGLRAMANILAKVKDSKRIRYNAVAPGLTRTSFTESFPEEYFAAYQAKTPLARLATVDDIASAIVALDNSLTYVNGQTLLLDGGYH